MLQKTSEFAAARTRYAPTRHCCVLATLCAARVAGCLLSPPLSALLRRAAVEGTGTGATGVYQMSVTELGEGIETQWEAQQQDMQARILTHDVLDFDGRTFENLRYIGGVDISWDRRNARRACATLVVCEVWIHTYVHTHT
jgi:hypothetical protein